MNGLLKKPAAFISAACCRISGTADRTITGSCASSGSLSCFARNCQPSISGFIRSKRITQGTQSVLSFSSPSSPSRAVATARRQCPFPVGCSHQLRRQRPLRVEGFGLRHEALNERIEVLFLDALPSKDTPHGSPNRSANIVPVSLGPVHPEVPLDGLNDFVDEVAKERLLVDGFVVLRDRVIERDLVSRQ